jgi:hypothetical protein
MFIHIGGDIVVRNQDVIAILDYGKKESKTRLLPFLEEAEEKGNLIWITKETTKSIIITNLYVYGSPISSLTLGRRV